MKSTDPGLKMWLCIQGLRVRSTEYRVEGIMNCTTTWKAAHVVSSYSVLTYSPAKLHWIVPFYCVTGSTTHNQSSRYTSQDTSTNSITPDHWLASTNSNPWGFPEDPRDPQKSIYSCARAKQTIRFTQKKSSVRPVWLERVCSSKIPKSRKPACSSTLKPRCMLDLPWSCLTESCVGLVMMSGSNW